jgi:tetratricopeptide (TPR) repeat protein
MQERWEEARTAFERSLAVTPNATGYSNLGTLLFYQDQDYPGAARLFQKALAINDLDYRIWFNLASAYYWSPDEREKSMGPYRHAAALAEEQRLLSPGKPDLTCHLAACYAILGNRDTALSLIRSALATRPVTPDIYERSAEVFALLRMPKETMGYIDSAMQAGVASVTIRRNPVFTDLRTDERYQELLRRFRGKDHH